MQLQFLLPLRAFDRRNPLIASRPEIKSLPIKVLIAWRHTKQVFGTPRLPVQAIKHPAQHPHVVAKSWPHKSPLFVGSEPVHAENVRHRRPRLLERLTKRQPVRKVVPHVVPTEGQHGEGVPADNALLTGGRSGRLRAHRSRHVDAFDPITGFGHQRHGARAPAPKNKGINGYPGRIVPGGVDGGALRRRCRKSGIRMSRFAAFGASQLGGPIAPGPIQTMRGRFFRHALPPNIAIIGQGHIGKNHIGMQGCHRVRIGFVARPGGNAKIARFWIDGI